MIVPVTVLYLDLKILLYNIICKFQNHCKVKHFSWIYIGFINTDQIQQSEIVSVVCVENSPSSSNRRIRLPKTSPMHTIGLISYKTSPVQNADDMLIKWQLQGAVLSQSAILGQQT